MKTVAIITPNYNRSSLLIRLYESLKRQTVDDFIWYVIDDGSRDDPSIVVNNFINENKVKIVFEKKSNGGKHTCINYALDLIKEPLVMIVDNDDMLCDNAIETIIDDYQSIKAEKGICGLGYLKAKFNNELVGKPYTKDGIIDSFVNERYNKETYGDKCEVFKTEILKKYPFPVFDGENFISEAVVWAKMSLDYKMKFFNKIIYLCEYQEGGLSDGVQKRLFKNPQGASLCYLNMTSKQFKLKYKIKYTVAYILYSLVAHKKRKDIIKNATSKFLCRLLYLPSKMLYKKRLKLYAEG